MFRRGAPPYYVTSPDRLGLALASGSGIMGVLAAVLSALGGERAPAAIGVIAIGGALIACVGIVLVFGPVWFALHRAERRGPLTAAAVAGTLAFGLTTIALMIGSDPREATLWAMAAITALPPALAAAATGAAMQRIAYRRLL
ncbi:hypothetical protein [Sphingomonas sp.]|uniref:hypothetical protein n=1 Tax=Sphingomonas sp. TaxID=28214 RepID=UPI002DD6B599|nr:hypothetical protein [Sphingomonas sp.]